jgi:ABC-type phosphate transport system auxiliary subunit
MTGFHNWLQTQKFEFTDANFTKEYEAIRRRMQGEIYKTAFSVDESTKYILETDPEVEAAVAAMPQAQALLDRAGKVRAERAQK